MSRRCEDTGDVGGAPLRRCQQEQCRDVTAGFKRVQQESAGTTREADDVREGTAFESGPPPCPLSGRR